MAEVMERLWYGVSLSLLYNLFVNHYIHNVGTLWLFIICIATFLIGDFLIARLDRWRIKRRVKREIIKAIKDQGLNPKDFEIGFDKVKITQTDDPDFDVLTLKIKEKKDEEA